MSKAMLLMEAVSHIDDRHLEAFFAQNQAKKKRTARWAIAIAACLCLVVSAFAFLRTNNRSYAVVKTIYYNGNTYWLCGVAGEGRILQKCGLPGYLNESLAGQQLGYLKETGENVYEFTDKKTDIPLFEYGPLPNENVYLFLLNGQYYAAVRREGGDYVDIYGNRFNFYQNAGNEFDHSCKSGHPHRMPACACRKNGHCEPGRCSADSFSVQSPALTAALLPAYGACLLG